MSMDVSMSDPLLAVIRGSLSISDVYSVGTDELWPLAIISSWSLTTTAPTCLHQLVLFFDSSFSSLAIGSSLDIITSLSGIMADLSLTLSLSQRKKTDSV